MIVALGVGGGLYSCGVLGARWFAEGLIWWRVGISEVDLRNDRHSSGWVELQVLDSCHDQYFPRTTADSSWISTFTRADLRAEDRRW